ncbi:MAG: hypothetical protein IPJ16_13085 [Bacteroidales bacterium]|nr:hypothetical protein [Bacteroidales bacterium]
MEEIEEVQEIEKPVSADELSQYLADKFDIPGRIERKQTIPEMFAEIKKR